MGTPSESAWFLAESGDRIDHGTNSYRCCSIWREDHNDEGWADLLQAVSDAARLRSLAARMDSHLNRGRSFTGAEVAAMLRDGDQ